MSIIAVMDINCNPVPGQGLAANKTEGLYPALQDTADRDSQLPSSMGFNPISKGVYALPSVIPHQIESGRVLQCMHKTLLDAEEAPKKFKRYIKREGGLLRAPF
jgi:hypothetical protein